MHRARLVEVEGGALDLARKIVWEQGNRCAKAFAQEFMTIGFILLQVAAGHRARHCVADDGAGMAKKGSMPFCVETGVMERPRRRTGEAADA